MARLFITPREINFINDIGKEIVKDVVGQKIYYFPISEVKSKVHTLYEEAIDKIFNEFQSSLILLFSRPWAVEIGLSK